MNKLDLIKRLKEEMNLSLPECHYIVERFFENISRALVAGDRVEIRGLCSFHIKQYESYNGRNPKTGEIVKIKPKKLPFFKAGKELKARVDSGSER